MRLYSRASGVSAGSYCLAMVNMLVSRFCRELSSAARPCRNVRRGGTLCDLAPEEDMAEPSYEELKARLAELERSQGERRSGALSFKVSDKGGVSVYGLGRFPVTLYYEQWTRLLDVSDELRKFLEENKSRLKLKER